MTLKKEGLEKKFLSKDDLLALMRRKNLDGFFPALQDL